VTYLLSKGNSLDGGEAEASLEQLETIFCLYDTREEDKRLYTSLAFPADSPARAWFLEQKHLGRFRDDTDPEDVVIYRYLRTAFADRFKTPLARRYAIEDTWDRFQPKGSVREHHQKFTKVWQYLQHLGIHHSDSVVASKYLCSLKPELFQIICAKNKELPDFSVVHDQAIEAEYQLRPNLHRPPQLNGIFPPTGTPKPNPPKPVPQPRFKSGKPFFCQWHKENSSHDTKDCEKVKKLKAAGQWNDNNAKNIPNKQ
jgi:hypothetical protein